MPQINRVPFKYDPVPGDLYLDHFRSNFHMERLPEVKDALQQACFDHDVVKAIEGDIKFSDADGENPLIRDVRYARYNESGKPWSEEIEVE